MERFQYVYHRQTSERYQTKLIQDVQASYDMNNFVNLSGENFQGLQPLTPLRIYNDDLNLWCMLNMAQHGSTWLKMPWCKWPHQFTSLHVHCDYRMLQLHNEILKNNNPKWPMLAMPWYWHEIKWNKGYLRSGNRGCAYKLEIIEKNAFQDLSAKSQIRTTRMGSMQRKCHQFWDPLNILVLCQRYWF